MYFKIRYEDMDWIHLANDRAHGRDFLDAAIEPLIS
jgi:hypothetical protein